MAQFDPTQHPQPLFHSGTFNGNNMTMTAGEVALRRLDAAAIARINALGESLAAGGNGIFAKLGIRAQCLGYGSMQQIHWTDAALRNMGDARRASLDVGELYALLQVELMNRGVYSSNRGMFSVPTPAQESEIDLALHAAGGRAGDADSLYARGCAAALALADDSGGLHVRLDLLKEALFGVVLRGVADDAAGIGDTPDGVGVGADAVEDLEGHTQFVADVGGFDAFDE